MARRHASFVVRCWLVEDGERRIEIEHVQSGSRTRVGSIAAAVRWMRARGGGAVTKVAVPADQAQPQQEQGRCP
jgi:hypothetical protein